MHAIPIRRAAMPRGLVAVVALLLCAAAGAADPTGSAPQEPPQETALDLSGVAPHAGPAGGGAVVPSDTFAPPGPGQPQVVELDADALFAALVNHTVRHHPAISFAFCILRMGGARRASGCVAGSRGGASRRGCTHSGVRVTLRHRMCIATADYTPSI